MSLRRDGSLDDGLAVTDAFDDAFDVDCESDFDALMEASSLGAPPVKAALRAGSVPEDVHRRVARAAAASAAGVPAVRPAASEVEEAWLPAGTGGDLGRLLLIGEGGRGKGEMSMYEALLGFDVALSWFLFSDRDSRQAPDAWDSEVSLPTPAWQRWQQVERLLDEALGAAFPVAAAEFWWDEGAEKIRHGVLGEVATAFVSELEVGALAPYEFALREFLFAGNGGEVARWDAERPGSSRAVAPYAGPLWDRRTRDLRGHPWVILPAGSPDTDEARRPDRLAAVVGALVSWGVRAALGPWWKAAEAARTSTLSSERALRTWAPRKLATRQREGAGGPGTGEEWGCRRGFALASRKGEASSGADRTAGFGPGGGEEPPSTLRSWWERDGAEEVLRGRILTHLCGPAADASAWPFSARLTYRASDPYAVEMVFKDPGRGAGTSWMLARELLLEGLRGRAGRGDVQVWSEEEGDRPDTVHHDGQRRTYIRLVSPGGTALLFMGADHVAEFLEQSRRVVAPGTEHEHLSGGVAELEELLHGSVTPQAGEGAHRGRGYEQPLRALTAARRLALPAPAGMTPSARTGIRPAVAAPRVRGDDATETEEGDGEGGRSQRTRG
ncbi:SsgA family sporulation/cell division regulator [Streptomyces sp. NPDC056773]|uniref:SsgA family sporulation/cell division regulator n=1 Tax=unclassified Streptomyces TaxID=2593676 RepID=UPI003698F34D